MHKRLNCVVACVARVLFLAVVLPCAVDAQTTDSENLVLNGDFAQVKNGKLVGWVASGDRHVTQRLEVADDQGNSCAKLVCTRFRKKTGGSHVMLVQVGIVKLVKGQWYEFSCRARCEGMQKRTVELEVQDMTDWRHCGLSMNLSVSPKWRVFRKKFEAGRSVGEKGRLYFAYLEVGTLFVDDVRIVPASAPPPGLTHRKALGAVSSTRGTPLDSLICMLDEQGRDSISEIRTLAPPTTHAYTGRVDFSKRFLAWGFDDGRQSDFEWVAPLFSKYGFRATFNIISTEWHASPAYANKVRGLIAQGHEIGDHTILHRTYMYYSPLFNGQPDTGGDGGQVGFPCDRDFTRNVGNGRNALGRKLADKVGRHADMDLAIITADTRWKDLTPKQCRHFRETYSAFARPKVISYLDRLSNEFCGTSGNSVGSWRNGRYTGGIFTDCRTSANHEIWERLCDIQQRYYRTYYGLNSPLTEWSLPGGNADSLQFMEGGLRYYDGEKAKLCNDWAAFPGSRIRDANGNPVMRSWVDVLRKYGYQHVHDSYFVGRRDGQRRRMINKAHILNAHMSKRDAVGHISVSDNRVNLQAMRVLKTYTPEDFKGVDDVMKYLYEHDRQFKQVIDRICKFTARGTIPYGATDSLPGFTWKLFYELYIRFCYKAGIEMITKSERYDIAFNHPVTEGNLFANSGFERLAARVINSNMVPEEPDGWNGGKVVTNDSQVPGGAANVLLCDQDHVDFYLYGVPLGVLKFSFAARKGLGGSRLTIRKIRNADREGATSELDLAAAAEITDRNWAIYNLHITLEDAPLVADGIQGCEGQDNKICGLFFRVSGKGTRVALPYLRKLRTDELDGHLRGRRPQ